MEYYELVLLVPTSGHATSRTGPLRGRQAATGICSAAADEWRRQDARRSGRDPAPEEPSKNCQWAPSGRAPRAKSGPASAIETHLFDGRGHLHFRPSSDVMEAPRSAPMGRIINLSRPKGLLGRA